MRFKFLIWVVLYSVRTVGKLVFVCIAFLFGWNIFKTVPLYKLGLRAARLIVRPTACTIEISSPLAYRYR